MPLYTLNRNYLHRSTLGHSVGFEKGVPAYVPPELEREVSALGAERVDGQGDGPLGKEEVAPVELSAEEREIMIAAAFEQITKRNDSKDFTGQGVPTIKAVEKIVSFDVERTELVELWQRIKLEAA